MKSFISAIVACAFVVATTCRMTDAAAEDIGNSLILDERALQAEWQDLDEKQAGELTLRNMRGLVRAMHKYDEEHGSLPPAVVPNPHLPPEKRLSGFVLLLPFLDATDFARDGKEGQRFFNDDLSAMAKSVGETIDLLLRALNT